MLRNRLIINSSIDRQKGDTHSNFRVDLNESINSHEDEIMIGLKKVSLPNTAYTFHLDDSWLWYLLGGTLHKLELPTEEIFNDGDDLANELDSRFQAKGHNITAELVPETNRIKLTNNETTDALRIISSEIYEKEVNGTQIVNSASHKLGFIGDLRDEFIEPGTTYEANGVPKIISTSVFHITSKEIGNFNQSVLPTRSNNAQRYIIYSALNTAGFGEIINKDINHDDMLWFQVDGSIESIDIAIRDEFYRIVSLNGGNVFLEFEFYRKGR